ncbi:hypothetical protein [Paraburkholderia bannensis]|uniref:hypothetical protein n=1 Tax=Paraburkholderia bannensis TaxID=765414 RepID=UPI0004810991|nr:hypothetical protein [Paraburkholderia bannensis]
MKINFVDDGNLTSWFRLTLIAVGFALDAIALTSNIPNIWARILLLLGFLFVIVGGMASRAKLLHIKPFDNSYKKARKSYETKDDKNGKQGGT